MRQHFLGLAALLVVSTGFFGANPQDASAQQIRVIAEETQVRLGPNPDSPIAATLGASSIPVLQPQYAEADAMGSSGRTKIFVGLALVGTSWAALQFLPFLSVPDKDDYADNSSYQDALDRRSNAETGQKVVAGLGLAVSAWGLGQVVRASRMRAAVDLEARRAAAPGSGTAVRHREGTDRLGKEEVAVGHRACGRFLRDGPMGPLPGRPRRPQLQRSALVPGGSRPADERGTGAERGHGAERVAGCMGDLSVAGWLQ